MSYGSVMPIYFSAEHSNRYHYILIGTFQKDCGWGDGGEVSGYTLNQYLLIVGVSKCTVGRDGNSLVMILKNSTVDRRVNGGVSRGPSGPKNSKRLLKYC